MFFAFFTLFLDFSPPLSVETGRFCSARPADALTNPHHCFCSQPVDGDAASIQPQLSSVSVPYLLEFSAKALQRPCSIQLMYLLLNRSAGHIHKRHTSHLKVPFYVGERFNEEFTGNNLKNVERSVEEDYISNLRNNCWKEKQQSGFSILQACLVQKASMYNVVILNCRNLHFRFK